jgi:hypothetical protein
LKNFSSFLEENVFSTVIPYYDYICELGKYRGNTAFQIYNKDAEYCEFIISNDPNGILSKSFKMINLANYIYWKQSQKIEKVEDFPLTSYRYKGKYISEVINIDLKYLQNICNDPIRGQYEYCFKIENYLYQYFVNVHRQIPNIIPDSPRIPNLSATINITYRLYIEGHSLLEISRMRKIKLETVMTHLAECIKVGCNVNIFEVIDQDLYDNVIYIIETFLNEKIHGYTLTFKTIMKKCEEYDIIVTIPQIQIITSYYHNIIMK